MVSMSKKGINQIFRSMAVKYKRSFCQIGAKGCFNCLDFANPEFPEAVLIMQGQDDQWFNSFSRSNCSIDKNFFIGDRGMYLNIRRRLSQLISNTQNIHLVDGIDLMCKERKCNFSRNGVPLYKDDDHISNHAARSVILPALRSLVDKNKM